MFWQKELETLSREELAELQLKRLRQTVRLVGKQVPFYRDKFKEMATFVPKIFKP